MKLQLIFYWFLYFTVCSFCFAVGRNLAEIYSSFQETHEFDYLHYGSQIQASKKVKASFILNSKCIL